MSAPRLSLVLPVYNELDVLATTLTQVFAAARATGESFEVICVDDGSTDGSAAWLEREARDSSELHALITSPNHGKGAALRTGVLAARGERIVCMDADLSVDLEALPRALYLLDGGAAVVLGDRHIAGARVLERQAQFRERLGRVFGFLARRLVDPTTSDFTCGFKAFHCVPARRIFERIRIEGWAFDAELVAIVKQLEHTKLAMAVTWTNRSGSKVRLPWDALRALSDLVLIAMRARRGEYRREPGTEH